MLLISHHQSSSLISFSSVSSLASFLLMASLGFSLITNYATTPTQLSATQRSSNIAGLKTHHNMRSWFEEKPLHADLKAKKQSLSSSSSSSNGQFRVSMVATEPEVIQKIPVKPPSLEGMEDPSDRFPATSPFQATVVSNTRIVGRYAAGETRHVVLQHDGEFPHLEGQSLGVIPPGSSNPAKDTRYFSIASTRYGDYFNGNTLSLCVRRREEGADVAAYLCDTMPGDKVRITGPNTSLMTLPVDLNPKAKLIMVATGTGVAPFRAHLRRLFMEDIPNFKFQGLAWLFHGVANRDSLLYSDEFTSYLKCYPDNFRYDKALSKEDQVIRGMKNYIQVEIEKNADEILKYLDEGAIIYFAGLEGMMPGIVDALKKATEATGQDWDKKLKKYKSNNQWREEVY